MTKITPLENTVVHVKTQAEYDYLMQILEDSGCGHQERLVKKEGPDG